MTETILRFVQSNFSYALPFVKAVMDETFKKVGLKAFQTLTVDELLWGHVDPDLTKAHDILMKLAKSRDPTIDLKLPERFSLQVSTKSKYGE